MAYPTDHTDYDTRRMSSACRALIHAMTQGRLSLQTIREVKRQFIALNLTAIMPQAGDPIQYVHKEPDAPTRLEILDISAVADYVSYHFFNEGAVPTLTRAQVAAILDRYAK